MCATTVNVFHAPLYYPVPPVPPPTAPYRTCAALCCAAFSSICRPVSSSSLADSPRCSSDRPTWEASAAACSCEGGERARQGWKGGRTWGERTPGEMTWEASAAACSCGGGERRGG